MYTVHHNFMNRVKTHFVFCYQSESQQHCKKKKTLHIQYFNSSRNRHALAQIALINWNIMLQDNYKDGTLSVQYLYRNSTVLVLLLSTTLVQVKNAVLYLVLKPSTILVFTSTMLVMGPRFKVSHSLLDFYCIYCFVQK